MKNLLKPILSEKFPSFKSQTKGILKRFSNYQSWESHLKNTKEVSLNWANKLANKRELNILGTGSLIDIDLDQIEDYFNKIILTDASIYNKKIWDKKNQSNLVYFISDVTGILLCWEENLSNCKFSKLDEYLEFIEDIHNKFPPPINNLYKAEYLLSLNILSQLPIYWQDFVFNFLENKLSKSTVNNKKELILRALIPSSKKIIESHLNELMPKKNGSSSLLICDLDYYFNLTNDLNVEIQNNNLIPTIKIRGKNEEKIIISKQDALYEFDIKKFFLDISNKYSISVVNSWLWEVVPYGVSEEQETHLVAAFEISHKKQHINLNLAINT